MRNALWIAMGLAMFGGGLSCKLEVPTAPPPPRLEGIGIDLSITDGLPAPLTVAAGERYYIDGLALRVAVRDFPTPDAMEWLEQQSDFSHLDWVGMNGLGQEWEADDGIYGASRAHQDARWMTEDHDFTLRVLNDSGSALAGPVELTRGSFVMTKRAAFSWISGATGVDDLGQNAVTPTQVGVVAAGAFSGPAEDVYLVEVVTGGAMDGTAMVDVSSVRGDDTAGVPVSADVPFDLSAAGYGVSVTFSDLAPLTDLVAGDRWVVRCTAPGEVCAAEPGTRATFGALANIILQVASDDAELFAIPTSAASIELTWSARPDAPFLIPVTIAEQGGVGYGLEVGVSVGERYEPGDTVEVKVHLYDREGSLLHDNNSFPTYREFIQGMANGIQYFDFRAPDGPCEVETDCRENIMYVRVAGPRHLARQAYEPGPIPDFFNQGTLVPEMGLIFGGFGNPDLWDMPVSNSFEFELPADAEAGTYSVVVKSHRRFQGETSYAMKVVPFQVGTDEETRPPPTTTGACSLCHVEDAALERLRHGTPEPYVCNLCHAPPFGSAAELVHHIHFISSSLPVARNDCSICHLTSESNQRASVAACGACHGEIHEGEFELGQDRYAACGTGCHKDQPAGHVIVGPQ